MMFCAWRGNVSRHSAREKTEFMARAVLYQGTSIDAKEVVIEGPWATYDNYHVELIQR